MQDLVVNLVASVLSGTAVWAGQRLLRYQRRARMRAFFGIHPGTVCLLLLGRHFSSPHELSVHRRDVAAAVAVTRLSATAVAEPTWRSPKQHRNIWGSRPSSA
ncbi:hypothetical protein ACNAW0_29725 [Micromonospora sp. SL1-18]|uniref:hypothetical protein n=1 Tax=Micromonospora sp. SL1-18 TaxID=3399128 RepID=UPI003A4E250F